MSILNVEKIQPVGSGTTVTVNSGYLETPSIKGSDANFTGIITATSFTGSGANLTSIPAGNLTGALPAISGANLTGISAGGGKILQVIAGTTNTRVGATSNSWLDTNLSASITPSATSSKVLVMVTGDVSADAWKDGAVTVFRGGTGGTNLGSATLGIQYLKGVSSASGHAVSFNVLDTPSTTSATSYLVKIINSSGSGNINFPYNNGGNVSTIVLMEISA